MHIYVRLDFHVTLLKGHLMVKSAYLQTQMPFLINSKSAPCSSNNTGSSVAKFAVNVWINRSLY